MTAVFSLPVTSWDHQWSTADREAAIGALEQGTVLYFPQLRYAMTEAESRLLSPAIAGKSKNVSLNVSSGKLSGSGASEAELGVLRGMMQRFGTSSNALLRNLLPRYQAGLLQGRTSFRPAEIANRSTSWRKDDTQLHVDSFPSSPIQGKRILRVFSNVNPQGETRDWRLGEPFDTVARHYLPLLRGPVPGVSHVLELLGITKGRRSVYDHLMLQIHDRMKSDPEYQKKANQISYKFAAGSTWIVFTDHVSHAAMKGQYALEQTFYLSVDSMLNPAQAPVRVLERLTGRQLV